MCGLRCESQNTYLYGRRYLVVLHIHGRCHHISGCRGRWRGGARLLLLRLRILLLLSLCPSKRMSSHALLDLLAHVLLLAHRTVELAVLALRLLEQALLESGLVCDGKLHIPPAYESIRLLLFLVI